VKVLALNVRAGGTRATRPALLDRVLGHAPDVVVFSEFRANANGAALASALAAAGLSHQGRSAGRGNGVLIAAREPFTAVPNPFGLPAEEYPDAIVEAAFAGWRLFGVYLPGQDRKRVHLRLLTATARSFDEHGRAAMIVGDLNSGRNATDIEANRGGARAVDVFSTADLYAELETVWTEAWLFCHPNEREYSWYPFRNAPGPVRRNGWRIDKAFVSRALLPQLVRADYDHGFRTEQLSDHSALVVELRAAGH
jgi:exonuclease III